MPFLHTLNIVNKLRWAVLNGLRSSINNCFQNISSETTEQNSIKLHWKLSWVPLQKYDKKSQLINNNNKIADLLFPFHKHLLWNYKAKFNETAQEASLHDPLQKYNKRLQLFNNNNNKMVGFLFYLKKFISSETTIPHSMKL